MHHLWNNCCQTVSFPFGVILYHLAFSLWQAPIELRKVGRFVCRLEAVFKNDRQPVPQSSDRCVVRALYPFKDAYNQVCPPILGLGMCGRRVLLTFNPKIVLSIQQRFRTT
jgi:hypothetical protein